jgi:predicted regulator of Ras-like GTPase activity (Roadblock/LC7/MglB family)
LDKAFRICQNGLKVHLDYGSAHLVMAKINLDKGLYDWAENEVQKAIEFDGETRTTELLLSEIYIYKGEFNQACRMLENLNQSDPDNEQIKKLLDIARKIPLEDSTGIPVAKSAAQSSKTMDSRDGTSMEIEPLEVNKSKPSLDGDLVETTEMPQIVDLNDRQILKALITTPGIDGALLTNKDGLVIEASWNIPGETDLVGALAVEAAKCGADQMRDIGFGTLQSMMIETPESLLYLAGARGKLLAVVCSNTVNLGSLKMKLSSLMPHLAG